MFLSDQRWQLIHTFDGMLQRIVMRSGWQMLRKNRSWLRDLPKLVSMVQQSQPGDFFVFGTNGYKRVD
jgi:hypothetical protein